jgi:hypothetical protein
MDPHTGKFHPLIEEEAKKAGDALRQDLQGVMGSKLVLPDGSPVPDNWVIFREGEKVEIKGHTFEVKWIGRDGILFSPVPLDLEIDP